MVLPRSLYTRSLAVALVAYFVAETLRRPSFTSDDLSGQVAVVTGGSRGGGRGFAWGLLEAGATVYITGRTLSSLEATCRGAPGHGAAGRCMARVVDSADDAALEEFFAALSAETGGRLDILVNNAYSAIGYAGRRGLNGRPFWEQGMGLFDAVHAVGVRSHYKATLLALPMLRRARGRGLIVNTNSAGCVLYAVSVPYGMGKCAVDKMTSAMAMELGPGDDKDGKGVDVVSWWAKEPMRTASIRAGHVDGFTARRGTPPGLAGLLRFDELYHTALAGTLLAEGRVLAHFARDRSRHAYSGLAVMTGQLAERYRVRDERGVRAPQLFTVKFLVCALLPPLRKFAEIPEVNVVDSDSDSALPSSETTNDVGGINNDDDVPARRATAKATPAQQFVFGTLPDITIPQWSLKLLGGNPITMQWPWPWPSL